MTRTDRRHIALTSLVAFATVTALATAFAEAPPAIVPAGNPITEGKRVLGKILFWDEQLSHDNTVACGTCHIPSSGGADPRPATHPGVDGIFGTADDARGSLGVIRSGANGRYLKDPAFGLTRQVTPRNTPSYFGGNWSLRVFWDGRAEGKFTDPVSNQVLMSTDAALESQAVGPPVSGVEMAHADRDWNEITTKLTTARPLALATDLPQDMADAIAAHPSYPGLFAVAFGDGEVTASRIAYAIASYERTLIPDQSPFDRFRAGDTSALDTAETRGLNAFTAPQSFCNTCHPIPVFTDGTLRHIGLRPISEDIGLQAISGSFADRGRFKVPSLRNVALRRQFMHNGMFTSLAEVLRFYARAPGVVQFTDNQDQFIPQILVPPGAQADIVAFLGALTDPRAANETFPFDRPKLFSERATKNPLVSGSGVAGTNGRVPRMVAVTPPNIGNDQFQVGVDNGLVGASASLVISSSPPVAGELALDQVLGPVTLAGLGVGDGNGSVLWPIDDDELLLGQDVYFQWRVDDPVAPGGVALSAVAHATIVGVAAVDDPGPDPDPGPANLITDDSVLHVSKSQFRMDWKRHGLNVVADAFKLKALLNPDGAASAAGGVMTISVADRVLFTSDALAPNGRVKGVTDDGVSYAASFDARKGDVSVSVKGLDLRDVTGLSVAEGSGVLPLRLTVRIDGIGLTTPEAAADFEFSYRTKGGKSTKGLFRYAEERALSGVFACSAVKVSCTSVGAHVLRFAGSLTGGDGLPLSPTGPITLLIGGADAVVAPKGELAVSTSRVRIARGGFVEGLSKFDYRPEDGTVAFTTTALQGVGLPSGAALSAELPVRIEFVTADGPVAFETTLALFRKSAAAAKWRR